MTSKGNLCTQYTAGLHIVQVLHFMFEKKGGLSTNHLTECNICTYKGPIYNKKKGPVHRAFCLMLLKIGLNLTTHKEGTN